MNTISNKNTNMERLCTLFGRPIAFADHAISVIDDLDIDWDLVIERATQWDAYHAIYMCVVVLRKSRNLNASIDYATKTNDLRALHIMLPYCN